MGSTYGELKRSSTCMRESGERYGSLPCLAADKDLKERVGFDYRSTSEDISVFKWKENTCILLISNYHGGDTTSVKQRQKKGTKMDDKCATLVAHYNVYMTILFWVIPNQIIFIQAEINVISIIVNYV